MNNEHFPSRIMNNLEVKKMNNRKNIEMNNG